MKTYYRFDPISGEYLYEMKSASRFPATHKSLTAIEPPEEREGFARCFDRETQTWDYKEDHCTERCPRTDERLPIKVYDKETGQEREFKGLGPLPEDVVKAKPETQYQKWSDTKQAWEDDPTRKAAHDAEKAKHAAREAARQRVIENCPDIAIVLGLREPEVK